jgi:endonuclease/exonuclease/phosphatase family metal-dependent hydrolase
MKQQVKVATYNIRKCIGTDRKRNAERILAVLSELSADIIALQEADRRFGQRASAIPHHMFLEHSEYIPVPLGGRLHSIGWHGNAILVRKGIEVRHAQILPLPTLEPRGAVLAELDMGYGMLRVIGVHLDLSGLWRRKQIRALLNYLVCANEAMPTVLMGDFNQWSDRGALSEFAVHHYQLANTPRSFHSRRPVARLDRIIISHDLSVQECGVHSSAFSRTASDHLPIWATLQFA